MPAYNAADTIAASVAAVLNQQLDPAVGALRELIVVDDASTDGSVTDALAGVVDARLRVISRSTNGGPAAARMTGVAEASGDTLAFADADDLWLPGKLQAQCAAIRAHPTARASYCWVDVVDRTGAVVFADQRARYDGDVYPQLLTANFIYSGSNLVVDRAAFDETGGSTRTCERLRTGSYMCVSLVVPTSRACPRC